MQVELDYERVDKTIKMVTWLNPEGKAVAALEGSYFAGDRDGTVMIGMPRMTHVDVRVVYYEKSGAITVPLRLETGLGLGPPCFVSLRPAEEAGQSRPARHVATRVPTSASPSAPF